MERGGEGKQTLGWERWNEHDSTIVEQELFGHTLRLAQDPSSLHLGTTGTLPSQQSADQQSHGFALR